MCDHGQGPHRLHELPPEVFAFVLQPVLGHTEGIRTVASLACVSKQLSALVSVACSYQHVWELREGCNHDAAVASTPHFLAQHVQRHLTALRLTSKSLVYPIAGICFQSLLRLEVVRNVCSFCLCIHLMQGLSRLICTG